MMNRYLSTRTHRTRKWKGDRIFPCYLAELCNFPLLYPFLTGASSPLPPPACAGEDRRALGLAPPPPVIAGEAEPLLIFLPPLIRPRRSGALLTIGAQLHFFTLSLSDLVSTRPTGGHPLRGVSV